MAPARGGRVWARAHQDSPRSQSQPLSCQAGTALRNIRPWGWESREAIGPLPGPTQVGSRRKQLEPQGEGPTNPVALRVLSERDQQAGLGSRSQLSAENASGLYSACFHPPSKRSGDKQQALGDTEGQRAQAEGERQK